MATATAPSATPGDPVGGRVEVWQVRGRPHRVWIWTEAEWARLPDADRPRAAHYFGGLGWVDAHPIGEPS